MEDTVVIDTKLGKLRGRLVTSVLTNEKYFSFRGIPYGKPPLGELRFKAPQPFGGWEGVRDALEDGNDPKQRILVRLPHMDPDKDTDGDEDCLYLCVYTRELPNETETSSKKPVMVHIHGGGFAGGSGGSKAIGPDFFMGSDIVLVSFNYRCGPFGFLSLENDEAPGNAGLKDQTLVLKWVRDNIDSFGGDADNVTIFGISAGGASVHYHLLSPLSKGLFHRAIVQSGFANNPWALQKSPKKISFDLAKKLGFNSEDPHKVFEFLQSVPSDDIVSATKKYLFEEDYSVLIGLVFSPCVETVGAEKFLPDTPRNLMKRGEYNKVPTIFGLSENEGSVITIFTTMYGLSFEALPNTLNHKPELLIPHGFDLKSSTEAQKNQVVEEIKKFYFKGKNLSLEDFESILKYESDFLFNIGFGETRQYMANLSAPVYTYLFTNHSRCYCHSFGAIMGAEMPAMKFSASPGTCHGTDVMYLFRVNVGLPMPDVTEDYREDIIKHIKIWTTFATTGDPNVEELGVRWYRDSQNKPCYMDIGKEWIMKEGIPFTHRLNFWQQFREKYCKD